MRVYLPATVPLLAEWLDAGEVGPPPLTVCAVTPALREWYTGGDRDDLEYAAFSAAARLSLALLADDLAAPARRVVLAADVADRSVLAAPDGTAGPGGARLTDVVLIADVAAVHVDDAAAAGPVTAARQALADAEPDSDLLVEEVADHELSWYATQEVDALLASLR